MVSWIDKVSYYRRKGVPNRPASLSFTNWDEIDWDEKKQEKSLSYEEQIKSPHWQKRRLQILQCDNFACQILGSA